jgi:1,4-dihydroxy-2-naphthoate octaprenyltransferase
VRLVGQKLATAHAVKTAAFISFGLAALAGLALTLLTQQWILIAVGILAIVSAWFYTGGSKPYGYLGLGEIFVFVWFGLAAVIGTAFVQTLSVSLLSVVAAIGAGALACAMLVVNNLRDIETDKAHNKLTLAVRIGDAKTRALYVLLLWTAFGTSLIISAFAYVRPDTQWPLCVGVAAASALVAHKPGRAVINNARGKDLIAVLVGTGNTQLTWAALTVFAVVLEKTIS